MVHGPPQPYMVKKANGGFQLVIIYQELNAATVPQVIRMPCLNEEINYVGENRPQFFSALHCTQGFHQILLNLKSRDKTGFITLSGKYQYKIMPQGICKAQMLFQSLWTHCREPTNTNT